MNGKLTAQVKAVNRCHAYAMQLYQQLEPIFRPLVGQQVVKADGTLLKKIKATLPTLPNTVPLHVFFNTNTRYALAWAVKTCESIPGTHGCLYHEINVNIGDMQDGVLTALLPATSLRSDFTVEEIEDHRKVYEVAKKAADDARSALLFFGEY